MKPPIFLIVLFAATTAAAPAEEDWPQWRGPERTGVARGVGPAAWPEKLVKVWQVRVGMGHSSPVAVGGRAFQFSREDEREIARAIDLSNGNVVWAQSYEAPYRINPAATAHGKGPKSTPLAMGGRVFTLGIEGMLSCYEQSSGKLVWRSDFRDRFPTTSPLYGTAMSPMLAEEKLLVHLGGPSRGALMALDPGTGEALWANDVDGPGSSSPIVAAIGGTDVVVTQTEKLIIGVSLDSGDTLFRVPFTTPYDQNIVTPILHGTRLIFAGLDAPTFALEFERKANGFETKEVWRSESSFYMSTPVVVDDRLVGMSNRRRGHFVALDAKTGDSLWESAGRMGDNAALVLLGSSILALTNEGELLVLGAEASSFAPVRRYTVAESPTWAHPVPTSGGILIKDDSSLSLWSYE
jgi:outer membrane protein assembly factor BamB